MKPKTSSFTIQLAVNNIGTSAAFYGGILELPVEHALTSAGAPEHFIVNYGGFDLVFVEDSAVSQEHPPLADRMQMFPKGVGVTLHFQVENIEEIAESLTDEGLEIFYPLTVHPFGIMELWCYDPDGYLVVLEQPLSK